MKISVMAARITTKMKREDVAKHLGLSKNGYARKESGANHFYAHELAKLSELFGVPYANFSEAMCPVSDTKGKHPEELISN